jgi:hypothetical protein
VNDKVDFLVDNNSEMLEVIVNGRTVAFGNFWDFDYMRDVPSLLRELGINVEVKNCHIILD